jgi:hypothetical protein
VRPAARCTSASPRAARQARSVGPPAVSASRRPTVFEVDEGLVEAPRGGAQPRPGQKTANAGGSGASAPGGPDPGWREPRKGGVGAVGEHERPGFVHATLGRQVARPETRRGLANRPETSGHRFEGARLTPRFGPPQMRPGLVGAGVRRPQGIRPRARARGENRLEVGNRRVVAPDGLLRGREPGQRQRPLRRLVRRLGTDARFGEAIERRPHVPEPQCEAGADVGGAPHRPGVAFAALLRRRRVHQRPHARGSPPGVRPSAPPPAGSAPPPTRARPTSPTRPPATQACTTAASMPAACCARARSTSSQ